MELRYGGYTFTPTFAENVNYIKVRLDDSAVGKIKILAACDLTRDEKTRLGVGENEYLIKTDKAGGYTPVVGNVYQIYAMAEGKAPEGKVLRPVFTSMSSSEKTNGNVLDFIATNKAEKNVITVGCEEVDESKMKWFEVRGKIVMPQNAIRPNSYSGTRYPVSGMNIIGGGIKASISPLEPSFIYRSEGKSDTDGSFNVKGIYAADSDRISLACVGNSMQTVEYLTLSSNGLNETDLSAKVYEGNGMGQMVEKEKNVKGYVVSKRLDYGTEADFEIENAVRSHQSPYVNDIVYEVDDSKLTNKVDVNQNTIGIVPAQLKVTANISLNGHAVRAVEFTTISEDGHKMVDRVEAEEGQCERSDLVHRYI